jgi:hypothetical protein
VTLWDVVTRRAAISVPGDANSRMAFTPDGRTLAAGSGARNVRLWDLATRRPIATIKRQLTAGEEISLSPDGKTLALISGDSTVKLWSLAAGQEVATLKGHAGLLSGIEFSPDGRILATANFDGSVRLWRAASFAEAETLRVSASAGDRRVLLQWPPAPQATGYHVYRGPADAARAGLVLQTPRTVTDGSFDDRSAALTNGRTQTYGVAALFPRGSGETEEGPMAIVRATPLATPSGFLGSSINESLRWGAVALDAATGEITVRGSGHDIHGVADGCYFLNRPLSGDFQITVRSPAPPSHTHEWAKAGLMVRETLEPGSRHVSLLQTAAHGLQYLRRPSVGDATDYVPALGTWSPRRSPRREIRLRLTRRGDIITAEYSRDGSRNWRQVGFPYPADPPLPRTLYAGLAVTSHDPSQISEAKFSDLQIRRH